GTCFVLRCLLISRSGRSCRGPRIPCTSCQHSRHVCLAQGRCKPPGHLVLLLAHTPCILLHPPLARCSASRSRPKGGKGPGRPAGCRLPLAAPSATKPPRRPVINIIIIITSAASRPPEGPRPRPALEPPL